MARKRSAGLLMFRRRGAGIEVLLVHPGGPYWVNKDLGAWSIPKGEYLDPEEPLAAAQREFQEETGCSPVGPFITLGDLKQRSGKVVSAWAFEGDCDALAVRSNSFEMEWPPKSGKLATFPEVDRAAWFGTDEARRRILPGQAAFIDALEQHLAAAGNAAAPQADAPLPP
ncbi:MAG TPA: NUDIX domain-containing protein [Burkholderiaceae bacterium]|nr:NUDIX domain-containing protein [Burkholderiaceae bacterium]